MNIVRSLGLPRLLIAGVLLILVALVVGSMLHSGNSATATGASSPAACAPDTTTGTPVAHGAITEYAMPHPESDLMSPAIDPQGNIWFGEMGGNRLGRLNPTTHAITEWSPPQGQEGIMGIVADAHGTMWFAEEAANYIGRFVPATCQFTIYPLPVRGNFKAAPNGVALAPDGKVWFTQFGNSEIGALDPSNGAIKEYPLPIPNPNQPPAPYGITVDHRGIVWFTELEGAAIGQIDPATGAIRSFPLQNAQAQPNVIITAPDGKIWFTEMNAGVLGTIDASSGAIIEHQPPTSFGAIAQLYDVVAASGAGTMWMTSSGANALLRYEPTTDAWSKIPLPEAGSAPYGLVLGTANAIWFTEGARDANRLGQYIAS